MVFHDLAHDRQTQTRALGAGGDIGFGQTVLVFGRQADAIVGDVKGEGRAIGFERNVDAARLVITLGDARGDAFARIL